MIGEHKHREALRLTSKVPVQLFLRPPSAGSIFLGTHAELRQSSVGEADRWSSLIAFVVCRQHSLAPVFNCSIADHQFTGATCIDRQVAHKGVFARVW